MTAIFWWVVFPYVTLTILVAGLLFRFTYGRMHWTAPSTEIFEKRWLRVGSPLFHYGIIFAFVGHVMGMLVPIRVYEALGVSDEMYHLFGIIGGGVAGLMVVAGMAILLVRKWFAVRVRAHTGFGDYFAVLMVLLVAVLGTYITIVYDTTVAEYEYRATIGPWFRSLFALQPQYDLMVGVPFIFQLHVVVAFLLFASIPFTKLVHIFSLPIRYPTRAPIQYRSRRGFRRQPQRSE